MLLIPGEVALSDFRKQKLCAVLRDAGLAVNDISASFIHLIKLEYGHKLSAADHSVLTQLLQYGQGIGRDSTTVPAHALSRVTIPRFGTISPWASKATDIVHHCGLVAIRRVERGIEWKLHLDGALVESKKLNKALEGVLYDPMIESCVSEAEAAAVLFDEAPAAPLNTVNILDGGRAALEEADARFGFALSDPEVDYLLDQFSRLGRNPTDVELMMFAQVNSEHCRHKIFNADWRIDGLDKSQSLFGMIRTTHQANPLGTLVAYSDNAAILAGPEASRLQPMGDQRVYAYSKEAVHFTAKVETHNHPTAISPFPGASTGSGGEIRDEGATGRGGKPKAGLCGFSVSHLRIPGLPKPWEPVQAKPERIASPLQIMLEGPIGAAAFNNEFGRPGICGYFRNFELESDLREGVAHRYGYHKPIMLAGGLGNIRPGHTEKQPIAAGAFIVVLGGPTMLIGLGGGAASSVASGRSEAALDFASVQRGNPEMQRRCQEVIDACCALGEQNPIVSIHDVGAGGLCNALPELVHDAGRGGRFELRDVLNDEPGMSPMQIWCNESQERYVMAISPERFAEFETICVRERCLFAKVGEATVDQQLVLTDRYFGQVQESGLLPINLSMDLLFGLPPKMFRDVTHLHATSREFKPDPDALLTQWRSVLSFPAVADKSFLVTIGDRSVTGLIARDQMVGPWQVPVADAGVTCSDYRGVTGEAMAVGERTPIAVIDAPASGRMAIGEALTNLASAMITDLSGVRLSANWMVAAGEPGQDAALFDTVEAVAMDLCPALGITIPVGKDSMSMATGWGKAGEAPHKVVSPVSLVVTAFCGVEDVRKTVTPELRLDKGETDLWLVDLGAGRNRLGGSILAQVNGTIGSVAPDVDAVALKAFMSLIHALHRRSLLLAYHDRSDGGFAATLAEMCFSARSGAIVDLTGLSGTLVEQLFNEELGAVIQTARGERSAAAGLFEQFGLSDMVHRVGQPVPGKEIAVTGNGDIRLVADRVDLQEAWSEVSWQMQRLRDNPACADAEYARIRDDGDPGMHAALRFDPQTNPAAPLVGSAVRPRVAILREQGVNGHIEMAAAFDRAGFAAVDVTMTDLVGGLDLTGFVGLAACGGFSYGDVLGAGEGWAKSILFNSRLRDTFSRFFSRTDTFALGVCNGCQMMSTIKSLIPGAVHWPKFVRNASEQYEARQVTVAIEPGPSVLLRGMNGSRFAVSVAHGEGRAWFADSADQRALENAGQVAMRFVDNHHQVTESYPLNSNGSPAGITGLTNADGRVTIMMPHPERVVRTVAHSWHPDDWPDESPWMRLFQNARVWVG